MKDMQRFSFNVGCKVARAEMYGNSPRICICEVTRIENGKIYLDNSKRPMKYPERLLIIEQDPLCRMIEEYEQKNNDRSS
jgi:hypothetical protein